MYILKLYLLISSTIYVVANSVDNNETNKSMTSTTGKKYCRFYG